MGTITQALRTAQSGLLVNQSALEVISQNIANVNTEGYSRKIVQLENRSLAGSGSGVQISDVTRRVDEGLLKSVRLELSQLNELSIQEDFFARMQDLFGAPGDNNSLSHVMERFSESLDILNVSPEKSLEVTEVVRSAQDLTEELTRLSETIQELRLQADRKMADLATEMNTIASNIDQLNDDIISNSSVGRDVSDLRDQRDSSIDRLAELVDIRFFFRTDGDAVVFTSSGRTLVDTQPPTVSHTAAASVTPTTTHAEGDFSGFFVGSSADPRNDITTDVRGGQLKGLIDIRDQVLTDLQSQIDDIAAVLRDTMNKVHNRGVPFPGVTAVSGTRNFIAPATQSIKLDPTNSVDDVAITLFDISGNQSATTTLNTIMTGAGFSSRGSTGDWDINDIGTVVQSWLRNNGASTATAGITSTTGKFDINLNSTTLKLAFRDQAGTANTTALEDVNITFDSNGDGVDDETIAGFSNFFGFNDFFVDNQADNVWESDVLSSSFTVGATETISFADSTSSPIGTITITAGQSLQTVVNNINLDTTLSAKVKASLVPDGSGFRIRFSHQDGSSMTVNQGANRTFLTSTGVDVADVRVSASLAVRADLITSPSGVSTAAVQFDSTRGVAGEFLLSQADETITEAMAETFTTTVSFKVAGGLPIVNNTFSQRASGIVATNGILANNLDRNLETQRSLTESLQFKSDNVRGVNLDEELAQLIVFEQAFGAAARVIGVIQRMFDSLDRLL